MATELENASLKLVLTLDEARAAVDEIEKEQERRKASHPPGYAAPTDTPVTRPDSGRSAIDGEKEAPATAPASGDARGASEGSTRGGATAAASVDEAGGMTVEGATKAAQRAIGFVSAPSARGAVALGGEIAASGATAGAEAVGLGATVGPAGLAVAAAIAAVQQIASRGPGVQGFARGVAGQPGVDILNTALFGAAGTTGLVSIDKVRQGWDYIFSRLDALDAAKDDVGEIAAAMLRTGGAVDSQALKGYSGALYRSHQKMNAEARARDAASSELRGEGYGAFTRDMLHDFIKGGR